MNSFVIGNDLIIKWKLVPPDGIGLSISDYSVKLRYKTSRGCSDVSVISIPINEDGKTFSSIIWEFKGRDQFATGKYDLILILLRDGKVKCVTEYLNAFELTCKQITKTPSCSVSISRVTTPLSNTLDLCSTIETWVFSPQDLGGIVKGITITQGEKKTELAPNENGKIDIQLGASLAMDDNTLNLVWEEN